MQAPQLAQAVAYLKSGDKASARRILTAFVKENPDDEQAWGWLYQVCENNPHRIYCLQQVVRINPGNLKAVNQLQILQPKTLSPFDEFKPKPWYRHPLIKALFLVFLTPIWTIIEVDDPDTSNSVKIIAGVLLVVYVLMVLRACNIVF